MSDNLRDQMLDAMVAVHEQRARDRIEARPRDHCAAKLDAIMPLVEDAIRADRVETWEWFLALLRDHRYQGQPIWDEVIRIARDVKRAHADGKAGS